VRARTAGHLHRLKARLGLILGGVRRFRTFLGDAYGRIAAGVAVLTFAFGLFEAARGFGTMPADLPGLVIISIAGGAATYGLLRLIGWLFDAGILRGGR
jgi:hypothetical protein